MAGTMFAVIVDNRTGKRSAHGVCGFVITSEMGIVIVGIYIYSLGLRFRIANAMQLYQSQQIKYGFVAVWLCLMVYCVTSIGVNGIDK